MSEGDGSVDRRALVTGAGRGIGRSIAHRLAHSGAEVLVNDVAADRAEAVAAEIVAAGGRAKSIPFDVTQWDDVAETIGAAAPIDVVVNNAGNAGRETGSRDVAATWLRPFVETEPASWDMFIRVNLYGVMHVVRAALPAMVASGRGRIITIVSDSARVGEPYMAAYAAAKAGAAGFMRSIAREVGRYGITANCVSLGTMALPEHIDQDSVPEVGKGYSIRRRGEPQEVAALVEFLAGPDAGWITGQTYPLNGGYSAAL